MFLYRLLQLTWGLPQTLAGAIFFVLNKNCKHYSFKGAIVTEWKSKSSLSLGMFLFVSNDPFYYYPQCSKEYSLESFCNHHSLEHISEGITKLLF